MKICPVCENEFKAKRPEQKYCGYDCSNEGRRRYGICECCDEKFRLREGGQRFCSRSCAAKVNNVLFPKRVAAERPGPPKSPLQKWLDGEWSGNTATGLSSTIRNFLLQEADFHCQSPTCCVPGGWDGVNPHSGKSALTVDHIDGNAYNNKRDNLIVLCPNCHSLTPTYGALNKGNGRKHRYMPL